MIKKSSRNWCIMGMEIFCQRVKSLRGTTSQVVFASKIGVSQNSYSRYESGERIPGIDVLAQIARTFGVSADWLLGIGTHAETSAGNIPPRGSCVSEGVDCADLKDATISKQAESILVQANSISTQADALSNQAGALSNHSQAMVIHAQTLNNNSQAMVNNSDSIKSLARTLEASIGCPKEATT